MEKNACLTGILLLTSMTVSAKEVNLYGAGGPHPAIKEVANNFMAQPENEGIKINVISGPLQTWSECAKGNTMTCEAGKADILWGTAEHVNVTLMEDFSFMGFSGKNTEPLYIRPAVILVQEGNPKGIKSFNDLIDNEKVKRIVVNNQTVGSVTSGTAVWEDLAGRLGSLDDIKKFRNKIVFQAPGSGAAFKNFYGASGEKADAWITWPEWYHANKDTRKVELVTIEPERVVYRDFNITLRNDASKEARKFADFLSHEDSKKVFQKYGFK
ncbi:substrate-binding domain-containing protein [Vibrio parahaemolyticus]|uniref:substrate-binding domain-containing protein n=1 Tax=Vibrio parahaemolyticus TaxID=670 RepID=UPI003296C06F